uniref:hypothetical protein n=1 Tax=Staphylococcus aureus TaxID=1280 RepID=UPI00301D4761
YPIGSLVRFEGGSLGWILGLDGQGRPTRVRLTDAPEPPSATLGEILQGEEVQRLGEIREEIPVST